MAGLKVLGNQKGVALVEMALVAPIFVVVLFGLLEFGYIIYSKQVLANASREGARLGVVLSNPRKTQAEIEEQVQKYLEKSGFDPTEVTVTYPSGLPGASGDPFAVRLDYAYNFKVLPKFIQSLTGSLGLTAEAVMLME
ncbi:MAG: pilus assembly protein [Deltaproteobacteria bacterium]|nr:pilus assembly protein [Deltaproteobacteria bacterium]